MTTDEKKNEERQVSRRQLFKTGVGLVGAGLAIGGAGRVRVEQPSPPAHCLPQETNRWWA